MRISIDSKINSKLFSKVYTIDRNFSETEINRIANALHNPVIEEIRINEPKKVECHWVLELGFLPGVTDNVGKTASEIIKDMFKLKDNSFVYSSNTIFISEKLNKDEVEKIALKKINPLIERYHIKTYEQYLKDKDMDLIIPKVSINSKGEILEIDLETADLIELGKKGILDSNNVRRGTLALDELDMKKIKEYFKNRKPRDIEIESIAQTWSEHCKHTIFASPLGEVKEGLYKKYIKGATEKIRKKNDFCLSVFHDNAGGIIFNDEYIIADKVETHNSPSALDPFGGAITGIVGVNRDIIGFGIGALPIANRYGFCVAKPEDNSLLFRGKNQNNAMLPPSRILKGIIEGVNVGGNCSGIPTPTGFVNFDESYKGKPLVFVGTIGLIPRKKKNRIYYEKKALPNDNIVIIGGRVGKDGIHGATFSSETLDEKSPATAVQIGDPITQKKLSDAVIKEARDLNLFNSITDNGAGGLSCSVAEMAKECGGFIVDLEKVKLKYPGLDPWEIWISESQERMTLSISDNKLQEFINLMESRDVETTIIGKFNSSEKAIVNFYGKEILNLDMEFLHNGNPVKILKTEKYNYIDYEDEIEEIDQLALFKKVIGSHNICSTEFISKQYDHEVQSNSILKPLQGKGRVNGNTSIIKPLFNSNKGVVLSQHLNPRLSEINCYDMAANAIDTAIRNCVAVGGNINHLALLDNFCWCSSNDSKKLFQLEAAARGCYNYATEFMTPFISGKDSMFNDFKGFNDKNEEINISINPTLLISSIGVIEDVNKTCSMDIKKEGDLIYLIGDTFDEMGGSEVFYILGKKSFKSPKVNAKKARQLYEKMYEIHQKEIFNSCASIERGGLITCLAKMSIAGQLGVNVDIKAIPSINTFTKSYSESQSRFVVTINKKHKNIIEEELKEFNLFHIGVVEGQDFVIKDNKEVLNIKVNELDKIYRERFKEW